jgi:hypothetical protein
MNHLEHPSRELWTQRQAWFESVGEEAQGDGAYLVSEQACALTAEVQAAFCAGAWVAVIVLAVTVVDAALREAEVPGFVGNTKQLISEAGANPGLQALRIRRNALVHVNPDSPALTVDQQWAERDALEHEARSAVRLMFEAFYQSPWT